MTIQEAKQIKENQNVLISKKSACFNALCMIHTLWEGEGNFSELWIAECTKAGMQESDAIEAMNAWNQEEIGQKFFEMEGWLENRKHVIQNEINSLPSIPCDVYMAMKKAA